MQRSLLDVLIPNCHCSATSTRICVKFDANVVISNTPNPANLLDWRCHASKVSSGVKPEMRSDHGMMYSQPRFQLVGGSTGLLPTGLCNRLEQLSCATTTLGHHLATFSIGELIGIHGQQQLLIDLGRQWESFDHACHCWDISEWLKYPLVI